MQYMSKGVGNNILPCTLDDLVKEKKPAGNQIGKKMQLFLERVNALLNCEDGGKIIIHVDDHGRTDVFHQKVHHRLAAMIPDNALYDAVYQEYYLDKNHLLFEVLYHPERPFSVLDFKTKIAVGKGLEAPTHAQMGELVKSIIKEPTDNVVRRPYEDKMKFEEGKEAMVHRKFKLPMNNTTTTVPLKEGTDVQAKAFDPSNSLRMDYCADKSKESISAYSKNANGGTIYIGIKEKKIMDPATHKEINTGKLLVHGNDLNLDGPRLTAKIKEIVMKTLRWIGVKRPTPDQVTVNERKAGKRDGKEVYVVEIRVEYYHGLCFYDLDGPLFFKGDFDAGRLKMTQLGVGDWLAKYEGATERLKYDSRSSRRESKRRHEASGSTQHSPAKRPRTGAT
jgi:predicted HTH transcriptional regulator